MTKQRGRNWDEVTKEARELEAWDKSSAMSLLSGIIFVEAKARSFGASVDDFVRWNKIPTAPIPPSLEPKGIVAIDTEGQVVVRKGDKFSLSTLKLLIEQQLAQLSEEKKLLKRKTEDKIKMTEEAKKLYSWMNARIGKDLEERAMKLLEQKQSQTGETVSLSEIYREALRDYLKKHHV